MPSFRFSDNRVASPTEIKVTPPKSEKRLLKCKKKKGNIHRFFPLIIVLEWLSSSFDISFEKFNESKLDLRSFCHVFTCFAMHCSLLFSFVFRECRGTYPFRSRANFYAERPGRLCCQPQKTSQLDLGQTNPKRVQLNVKSMEVSTQKNKKQMANAVKVYEHKAFIAP